MSLVKAVDMAKKIKPETLQKLREEHGGSKLILKLCDIVTELVSNPSPDIRGGKKGMKNRPPAIMSPESYLKLFRGITKDKREK